MFFFDLPAVCNGPNTTSKLVTLVLVLPSGLDPGDFSIRVVKGGLELELTEQRPGPLTNLDMMHKKWL